MQKSSRTGKVNKIEKLIDEYNQGAPAYKKIYSLIIREKEFEKTASRKIKRY